MVEGDSVSGSPYVDVRQHSIRVAGSNVGDLTGRNAQPAPTRAAGAGMTPRRILASVARISANALALGMTMLIAILTVNTRFEEDNAREQSHP